MSPIKDKDMYTIHWFETIDLSVPRNGPVELREIFPCRCGVTHSDQELFLAHQELAPQRSVRAREIRGLILRYLAGTLDAEGFSIQVMMGLRNAHDDVELESLCSSIEWTFNDLKRKHITKEGLHSVLRQLALEPQLEWRERSPVLQPGEHLWGMEASI